jgi:LDH2 family malate/lactate/ureidoglycolate dehydrogenase
MVKIGNSRLFNNVKEVHMIHLEIHDAIELSTDKMLRNGVPQQEAEIAAPIFLEAELWGKHEHGFRYLETCLLAKGTEAKTAG